MVSISIYVIQFLDQDTGKWRDFSEMEDDDSAANYWRAVAQYEDCTIEQPKTQVQLISRKIAEERII